MLRGKWPITGGQRKLKDFLYRNLHAFAWRYEDMVGIDPNISYHYLKIDPTIVPYRQTRRAFNPERFETPKG